MAVLIPIKRISAQKRIDPAIALMCLDFLCLVGTEPNHLIIGGKVTDITSRPAGSRFITLVSAMSSEAVRIFC
jgi:hypothetical protein